MFKRGAKHLPSKIQCLWAEYFGLTVHAVVFRDVSEEIIVDTLPVKKSS